MISYRHYSLHLKQHEFTNFNIEGDYTKAKTRVKYVLYPGFHTVKIK